MNELTTKTLAQIVTGNHRAAAIFEKYNLDFCCKGKRSLQQACTEQNLAVEQLVAELNSTDFSNSCTIRPNFSTFTLTQLADYIVLTHHSYVRQELTPIFQYLQKVASRHGDHHPELLKIFELFTAVKEEMEQHMDKEELVLFPRIKEMEKFLSNEPGHMKLNLSYLLSPITVMQQEHDHAGGMMSEIRQLSNNYAPPPDACTTYKLAFASLKAFETDLHQHVHLENNILFPKALESMEKLRNSVLN